MPEQMDTRLEQTVTAEVAQPETLQLVHSAEDLAKQLHLGKLGLGAYAATLFERAS